MAWDKAVVGNSGIEMLTHVIQGEKLIIDYAAGGSGTVPEEALMAQTGLVDQKKEFAVVDIKKVETGQRINIQIDNQNVAEGFMMRQIGIWAHLEGKPVALFAILQDADGIKIPSETEIGEFSLSFYAVIGVSGSGEFQVAVDTSALVSVAYLLEKMAKKPDFIIGLEEPSYGNVLWFDTRPRGTGENVLLQVSENLGAEVTADIDGKNYGVENAGVNTTPTAAKYSFDIL